MSLFSMVEPILGGYGMKIQIQTSVMQEVMMVAICFNSSMYDTILFVWFLVNFVNYQPLRVYLSLSSSSVFSLSFIRFLSCWCV